MPRCGNHAARALEQHGAAVLIGQRARGGQAVGLHGGRGAGQQPRGLQGVRSQHGGAALPATLAQQMLQMGVGGHGVQRVCVQHQACRLLQDVWQHGRHGRAPAAAADHGGVVQRQRVTTAQHQFGLLRQGGECAGVQQRHHHAARAGVQRRVGG